jgi:hypothetical protein
MVSGGVGPGDGNRLQFSPSKYAIQIRGLSGVGLEKADYEFVFARTKRLPKVTDFQGAKMRVLRLV